MKYTFGPIASRRFGLSLGIDVSPNKKQCNFDCLYCELEGSKTTNSFDDDTDFMEIINQVKSELELNPNIEVITVTSNGEPTLYPYLDRLIDELNDIKEDKQTLILTNSSLIGNDDIQKTLSKFDIVKLSLDCISKECFKKLDRNHTDIKIENIIDGLIKFSKIYDNMVLEVLFVKDINDKDSEVVRLIDTIKQINPSRVDIGTIDRPPAYDVKPVGLEFLDDIAKRFVKNKIDNISISHRDMKSAQNLSYDKEAILELLKMRPITKSDIEYLFDDKSKKLFDELLAQNKIKSRFASNSEFFTV